MMCFKSLAQLFEKSRCLINGCAYDESRLFLSTKDQNTHILNYKEVLAIFCSFFPCCTSEPRDNDCDIRIPLSDLHMQIKLLHKPGILTGSQEGVENVIIVPQVPFPAAFAVKWDK